MLFPEKLGVRPKKETTMTKICSIVPMIAICLLAGCVTTPDFQMSEEQKALIPSKWIGPQLNPVDAVDLSKWWETWSDPEVAKLVQRSQQANTEIKIAQANLRAARAGVTVAGSFLFPSVDGSARASRNHSSGTGTNSFGIGLNGGWTIDAGGNYAAYKGAQANLLASDASLGDVQVAIAATVVSAYVNLRLAQRHLQVAQENVKTQQESLDIANWRYLAGLVDSTDVDQAMTSLEQTKASIPLYRAQVNQYRNLLSRLTSMQPQEVGFEKVQDIPKAPDNIALSIPAENLRNRPAVRMAEADVMAAMANHTEALSALYPSLNISGSFGLSGLTIGSLGSSGTHNSSILGSITLPIFNAGALRAQVEQADAYVQRANANYEASLLQGVQEVEDALNEIWSNERRRESLLIAVRSAQSAARSARQNYSAGLQDFTVVLTTQQSLLRVEESLASVEAAIAQGYINLYQALGGGWVVPQEFKENDKRCEESNS